MFTDNISNLDLVIRICSVCYMAFDLDKVFAIDLSMLCKFSQVALFDLALLCNLTLTLLCYVMLSDFDLAMLCYVI